MPVKVLHIITNLATGGAEMMLLRLLTHSDRSRFQSEVISLTAIDSLGARIQALGIPVKALHMSRKGIPNPFQIIQLARWIKQSNPDIVQTWMYHADLIGGVAAKMAGKFPVVWNIRHGTFDHRIEKFSSIFTAKMCAMLSSALPQKIICCAQAAKQVHTELGYPQNKISVITNGFETEIFKPNPEAGRALRQEFQIPENAFVVGQIGRFHPQKDHQGFIEAARQFASRFENSFFVLCGYQVDGQNKEILSWIRQAGLEKRFRLLGERNDIHLLMNAFDILSSASSFGEGFPTVVGEAMSCGIPCAVTDVGDSAGIVGDTGRVVLANDPKRLAQAWEELFRLGQEGRERLGRMARERIQNHFSLSRIIAQYENFYKDILVIKGKTCESSGEHRGTALMVSYTFPPLLAGGSIRIKNFSKYLPRNGWDCHILTLKIPAGFVDDESDLPSSDHVWLHRAISPDPFRAKRGVSRGLQETAKHQLLQWISAFLFFPDRQILWAPFAILEGIRVLKQYPVDIIFSTYGPGSNHLVAWALKTLFKKPWIADFRDLWARNKNLMIATPLHRRLYLWLEGWVVRHADRVIGVGEHINKELKRHTKDHEKFVVLSNGYDGELIREAQQKPPTREKDVFSIIYTGAFYCRRSPEVFLSAVKQLVDARKIPLEEIEIKFMSNFRTEAVQYQSIQKILTFSPLAPHREALAAMAQAKVFLLIVENDLKHQIVNAKFFDYIAFQKPILALVAKDSVCYSYLKQAEVSFVADPDDQDQIAEKILELYTLWKADQLQVHPNQKYISQFDVASLSARLAGVFHETIEGRTKRSSLSLLKQDRSLNSQSEVSCAH
ncbi:MAG: glycosyltransferase [Candidatus Omnitrophica bacterium]|nr:glycosyltransferase [Candidatus Omnitrophota bacterium]